MAKKGKKKAKVSEPIQKVSIEPVEVVKSNKPEGYNPLVDGKNINNKKRTVFVPKKYRLKK